MEAVLAKLGKNIKAMREKKKLSQAQLSEKAGVKQNYISRLENGNINITYSNLHLICKALEITPIHIV